MIAVKPFDGYYDKNGVRKKENEINFKDDLVFFYKLEGDNILSKTIVNLSGYRFIDKNGNRVKARSLMLPNYKISKMPKMAVNVPNPIDITAETSKLYVNGKDLTFTFDKNTGSTQVLKLNLDNFNHEKIVFEKRLSKAKLSNSFILDNNIFLASSNKKELILDILDLNTRKIVKTYSVNSKEEINFKNGPIIQEGGIYNRTRVIETTKQFLRKITADYFGVTALKNNNRIELTLGGYSPVQQGAPMMNGFGEIPIASFGNVTTFFNPTMFAYNNSASTKSTEINCLFSEDFEHVEGEIQKNIFYKINSFTNREIKTKELSRPPKNKTPQRKPKVEDGISFSDDSSDIIEIITLNEKITLGSYDKESKTYYFYIFKD